MKYFSFILDFILVFILGSGAAQNNTIMFGVGLTGTVAILIGNFFLFSISSAIIIDIVVILLALIFLFVLYPVLSNAYKLALEDMEKKNRAQK